jgi:hypothetical protein
MTTPRIPTCDGCGQAANGCVCLIIHGPEPAYLRQLRDLTDRGAFRLGMVIEVRVAHDDDCDIWAGRACNCEPTVTPMSRALP